MARQHTRHGSRNFFCLLARNPASGNLPPRWPLNAMGLFWRQPGRDAADCYFTMMRPSMAVRTVLRSLT